VGSVVGSVAGVGRVGKDEKRGKRREISFTTLYLD
jgi:hypothetical protein